MIAGNIIRRRGLLGFFGHLEIKFLLVGLVNTFVGFLFFTLATVLTGGSLGSTMTLSIATIPTLTFGFFSQKIFVWGTDFSHLRNEVIRFLVLSCIQYSLNAIILFVGVEIFKFALIPTQFLALVVMVPSAYLGQRFWVFLRKESKNVVE